MGLAKVLLGRGGKEAGRSKCARVDSLGLARRRLAAKAAQEELVLEMPDPEEPEAATATHSMEGSADDESAQQLADKDDATQTTNALMNRELTDSLRLHRRRFRERASLDLSASRFHSATVGKGVGHSSGASPSTRTGDDGCSDDEDASASTPSGSRQVRFRRRRASDGEYLNHHSSKGTEAGRPNALKAVQLKAERLFKRLTGSFVEPQLRPRSANFPPASSPSRTQRSSASRIASTSRSSSSWVTTLRHRSIDAIGIHSPSATIAGATAPATDGTCPPPFDSPGTPAPAAVTAPGASIGFDTTSRRAKRQSAPGELFSSVDETMVAGPDSPNSPSAGTRNRSVTPGKDSSVAKGRNWLARLSRGLQGGPSPSRQSLGRATFGSPPTSPHVGATAAAEQADEGRAMREHAASQPLAEEEGV